MPLTRHRIGNAYGLADPELYRAADKDDPEALLEGVAMAGLVGILRQLGDLAEFAAEMFHDLHEEVMVTAARGHGLMVRVQQLEMEFPSFEKAFLTQTDHSSFFSIPGMDWHPNLHMQQNLVTRGDLPRCVMDSYEECRGPPRLFLLDKFDVAGAGACLKRYSDPSFARVETVSSEAPFVEVQREKRPRKVKKKGLRGKNGGTPDIAPTSHAKLHQLFLEERVGSGLTNSARLVNLKSRKLNGFLFDTKSRRSYMEKLLQTPSPEHKPSSTISSDPLLLTWNTDDSRDSGTDIPEIAVTCAMGKSCQGAETEASSPDENELEPKTREDGYSEAIERDIETVPELIADEELPTPHKMISENSLEMDRKERSEDTFDENHSEDLASEVDNYMDALATIESETDNDDRPRKEPGILNDREQDADYQSIGNVSASNSTSGKGRSSFSYSDIGSISTVSDSFDGGKSAESLLPSISTFEAEVAGVSINNTSVNKDVQRSATYEHELVGRRDVDLEEASCSSNCRSSSHVRPGSEELDTDVNGMSLTDSLTSRVHPPGTLDGDDLGFTSKAIPNLVEIPQMALEEKGESTTIAAFSSTTYDDDNHSGDLANPDICFMTSVISSKEDQFSHSARPETEVYTDSAVSKLGELIPLAESHPESTARSIAETDNIPLSSGISMIDTEIRAPECTRDVPAVGTKASEPMANSPEIIFESRSSKDTEVDGSTTASETDAELKESMSDTSPVSSLEERQVQDAYLKYDNNYPEDEGLSNLVEVNVAIENVVAEEVAISNTDTSKVGEDIDEFFHLSSNSVCSPSTEPINILESNSGGELCRDGLESDKACYVGCDLKSGEKEETCILEVASQHLEPQPDISSCLEVSNDVQDSLDEPSSNHLRAGNDPINPVSADPKELETETNFPLQSSILERTVGALSLGYLDHDHHLDKSIKMNHLQATEAISCQTLRDISENPRCLDNKDLENYVKVSSGSLLETNPDQGLTSELSSQSAVQEIHTLKQTSGLNFSLQSFGLPPEATQTNMDGMPPLPPLPPMQWRIGKAQHTSVLQNEPILAVSSFIAAGDGQNSFSSSTPVSSQFSALVADTSSQHDIVALEGAQPVYPLLTSAVASITPLPEPSEHASLKLDVSSQIPVQELNQAEPENGILDEVSERFSHHSGECHHSIGTSSLTLPPSTVVENQHQCDPPTSESLTTQPSNPSKRKITSNSVEDAMWPVNAFALAAPTFDAGKAIEIPPVKVPRPRSPLVDAVAAHDRSKLKKVSELVRPSTELDVKETDSLLAQIRNKSVNLKPTVVTRPSIQVGTRTNLKVAAILEKANTIRQAMAGSDEDDDSDSWSDS